MSRKTTQVRLSPENVKGILKARQSFEGGSGVKVSFNSMANAVVKAGIEVLSKRNSSPISA